MSRLKRELERISRQDFPFLSAGVQGNSRIWFYGSTCWVHLSTSPHKLAGRCARRCAKSYTQARKVGRITCSYSAYMGRFGRILSVWKARFCKISSLISIDFRVTEDFCKISTPIRVETRCEICAYKWRNEARFVRLEAVIFARRSRLAFGLQSRRRCGARGRRGAGRRRR
jgi:hypothetical protein